MAKDAADIATIVHVLAIGADANNVTGRGDLAAGSVAQCDIVVASGVVLECKSTDGRISDAFGVEQERTATVGAVAVAGGVVVERSKASCRVVLGGVAIEGSVTISRVVAAVNVVRERISASGTIEKPAGVAKER